MEEKNGAMMWVVMPVGWQYDDNFYNRSGLESPEACFTLKEMAEDYARQKTIKAFKEVATEDYFGGMFCTYEPLNSDNLMELRNSFPHIKDDLSISQAGLNMMSEEQILSLIQRLDLEFYVVAEVRIYC